VIEGARHRISIRLIRRPQVVARSHDRVADKDSVRRSDVDQDAIAGDELVPLLSGRRHAPQPKLKQLARLGRHRLLVLRAASREVQNVRRHLSPHRIAGKRRGSTDGCTPRPFADRRERFRLSDAAELTIAPATTESPAKPAS
jgi:hypothetical protein